MVMQEDSIVLQKVEAMTSRPPALEALPVASHYHSRWGVLEMQNHILPTEIILLH